MNWVNLKAGLRDQGSYLDELESLRGWAIILVVAFHAYGQIYGPQGVEHSLAMSFISSGATGVTLFFVLSAFLLSMPFIKGGRHSPPSLPRFYISRALRIIPLYYLMILLAVAATGDYQTGARALLFQFTGFEMAPFGIVWWTLSTEMQFYILLPFLMWLSHHRLGRYALGIALLTWAYYYYSLVLAQPISFKNPHSTFLTTSLFSRLPAFLIGIGISYLYLSLSKRPNEASWLLRVGSTTAILLALWLLGLTLQHSSLLGGFKSELVWHMKHTYESIAWGVFILSILLGQPFLKKLFINPLMATLGKLSYSIYLVHLPIQYYCISQLISEPSLSNTLSPVLWAALIGSSMIIIIVSFGTYHLVERPFLKLKEKIPTRKEQKINWIANLMHAKKSAGNTISGTQTGDSQ